MRTFHHIGVPSTQQRPGETFLEGAKLYVTAVDADAMKIEWLRFLRPEMKFPSVDALRAQVARDIAAALAAAQHPA